MICMCLFKKSSLAVLHLFSYFCDTRSLSVLPLPHCTFHLTSPLSLFSFSEGSRDTFPAKPFYRYCFCS